MFILFKINKNDLFMKTLLELAVNETAIGFSLQSNKQTKCRSLLLNPIDFQCLTFISGLASINLWAFPNKVAKKEVNKSCRPDRSKYSNEYKLKLKYKWYATTEKHCQQNRKKIN